MMANPQKPRKQKNNKGDFLVNKSTKSIMHSTHRSYDEDCERVQKEREERGGIKNDQFYDETLSEEESTSWETPPSSLNMSDRESYSHDHAKQEIDISLLDVVQEELEIPYLDPITPF